MFEALKKKLSSWLGKPEDKKEKKKEIKKAGKKEKPKKAKKEKKEVEIKKEEHIEEIIEELEPKKEVPKVKQEEAPKPEEPKVEEEKKEGFFKKLKDKLIKSKEEKEVEKIIEEAETEYKAEEPKIKEKLKEGDASSSGSINKEEVKEVKEGFFSKLFKKFSSAKITEDNFNEIFQELEIILLENNVAIEVVEKIKEDLSKSLVGKEIKKDEIEKKITDSLKESILNILIESPNILEQITNKKESPYIILFFGINGSGKTTSIAKLASKLKKSGISTIMAAADTFRAASIEQLQTHGKNLDIEVIAQDYGTDPAAVAFDAIQYARKNHIKVVLIDTAGRMYTKQNLMKEMEKIVRISKPDLKIFVGESITGNDAVTQSQTFNESIGIDGIILTKSDVDEKGGAMLSVSYVTNKPIYFLGVGQRYNDLQDFKKSDVLKHIGLE